MGNADEGTPKYYTKMTPQKHYNATALYMRLKCGRESNGPCRLPCSVAHVTCVGGRGCHGPGLLPSPLMSYHTLEYTSSLSLVLDEDEMW